MQDGTAVRRYGGRRVRSKRIYLRRAVDKAAVDTEPNERTKKLPRVPPLPPETSAARRGYRRTALLLPPHQGHGDVTNDLQAGCAHLVDGVIGGVPCGVVEVHYVDGSYARLLQLNVIVDEGVAG